MFFEVEVEGAQRTLVDFDRQDVAEISFIWAHHSGGAFRAIRPDYLIDASECSDFLLVLVGSGSIRIWQEGQCASLKRGNMAFIDSRRSYSLEVGESGKLLWIRFPRELIQPKFVSVDNFLGHVMTGEHGFSFIAARSFIACAKASKEIAGQDHVLLMNICVDMVTALLKTEFNQQGNAIGRSRKQTLHRVEDFIDAHLLDSQLSMKMISEQTSLSIRTISGLFQDRGTTAGKWILRRRLDLCRQLLTDPREADKSIKEIAYGCGFNAITSFNRAFRDLYGETPSHYRLANS